MSILLLFSVLGDQASWIDCANPGPVFDDILISKLRPGHEMDIKLYAYKGLGRDHAKFSPVATAYYRLLPEITLKETISGKKETTKLTQVIFFNNVPYSPVFFLQASAQNDSSRVSRPGSLS